MVRDAWLPVGYSLPGGERAKIALFEGADWQVVETQGGGRALLASRVLASRWLSSGLVDKGTLTPFEFGDREFHSASCEPGQVLSPVADCESPNSKNEAVTFALALSATRAIDKETPLQDAIYLGWLCRLLPTYSISPRTDDEVILGYWLTGGANVSARSFRRLRQMLTWLRPDDLREIIEAAGFEVAETTFNAASAGRDVSAPAGVGSAAGRPNQKPPFVLAGRPQLEAFINEHIVDIVQNMDRYKALGIAFPSAVVLHGPPGCGKTFAVEQLIEYLGWPSFQVDASSVASPYIHETSRKVAEVFDKAIENAPSVLVIDEMEAFLADRATGTGHHRVEEVAEFLRRIPEASKSEVLILAMTNRVDMIDPAILRRGRFDHVLEIGYANEVEVRALMEKLLSILPKSKDLDAVPLAAKLAGRPLSDVAFVIREGARLAARSGKSQLDQESLLAAIASAPAREREVSDQRRIGFM